MMNDTIIFCGARVALIARADVGVEKDTIEISVSYTLAEQWDYSSDNIAKDGIRIKEGRLIGYDYKYNRSSVTYSRVSDAKRGIDRALRDAEKRDHDAVGVQCKRAGIEAELAAFISSKEVRA